MNAALGLLNGVLLSSEFWSAAAAVVAALVAAFQIHISRRDANRRATFEHLREVEVRLLAAQSFEASSAQAELIRYYEGGLTDDLSGGAKAHMALLTSLDLIAFARSQRIIDIKVADEYLKTLVNPKVIPLTFLSQLQAAIGDVCVFEHLAQYLKDRVRSAALERSG
jgi:hypothetical protein